MILRRLGDLVRRQDWVAVLLEIVILVVGVFLGLQVDSWNEDRKDRSLETRYLERIHGELGADIEEMTYALELANARRQMGKLLLRATEDPDVVASDPRAFITAVEQAGWTFVPAVNDYTFQELKYAGDLEIIRNENLRTSVAAYYQSIERFVQWSYLREAFQISYSDAALGVLTPEQREMIRPVQRYGDTDPDQTSNSTPVDAATALEALERLRARPVFVDNISRAVYNQQGMAIQTIRAWRQSAEDLRTMIEAELTDA